MQVTKGKISKVNFNTSASGIYLFNANNGRTRGTCEFCPKLTIKSSKLRQWLCFGVFNINFEQISHIYLLLPLSLNK